MDMEQFKEKKFWEQAFNEFLGSMLWVVFFTQAGGSDFSVGISYVVLRAAFGDAHWWTPWTIYRVITQKMDPIKGVFWVILQILGAYVSGHLMACLKMDGFAGVGAGDWGNWAANIKFLIGMCFMFHMFRMYHDDDASWDMNKSFFMIFAMAVYGWFMGGSNMMNFSWQFAAHDAIADVVVPMVFTLVAVVISYVKYEYILN